MNVASIIEPHPAGSVALLVRGEPITYGQLRTAVDATRGGLAGLGVRPGDRVVIACANGATFVTAHLAVLGLGAVAVPLNPTSPAPEQRRETAGVEATVVVVDGVGAAAWNHIDRSDVPSVRHVVAGRRAEVAGAVPFADLLAADPVPVVDVNPGDLAQLLFTSGTAGHPRAAMHTHGNVSSNLEQVASSHGAGLGPDDVVFGVLPLFHTFGLNAMLLAGLRAGACVVLVQRFDPATALDTIVERGVTAVPGAPPMWVAWADLPDAPPNAFAKVRLAVSGAAKLPEDAARRFRDRYGVEIAEGYGLTEATAVVTTSLGRPVKFGSIGVPLPGVEVRLVDADGSDVLAGDAGEIWVRGPNVFAGYWRDPEATARVLDGDGWLRTGDIAVADGDGSLYLVDRAKDLIIVSGFNVFPAEVEEVLLEHPAVAEAAVVGVPHPHTGEAVKAYVVLRPGRDADEDTLIDHCAEHLARYKCPAKVLVVDELPRSLGGKLVRRILR